MTAEHPPKRQRKAQRLTYLDRERPEPRWADLWADPAVAPALASRDVAQIYKHLSTAGLSQRLIAVYAGQSQSEISEILAGRRVTSYDVLVRIAEGLQIPRGRLGLAYTDGGDHATG